MSRFQCKQIIHYVKNQENLILNEERESIETPKWQMLELSDKYFKAGIIGILQWEILNPLETNEKIQSLGEEIADIKKNGMGI